MAERTRGMGRGLAAILPRPRERDAERDPELRDLPVDLIEPNPHQPRRRFDEPSLPALAGSLRERGMLQPVLVRPLAGGTYELIAGERRWRAAQLAGFDTIPALVRAHDDAASLELALIENMAREDLNPVEEARACALLVEELGLTREEVGRRVGRSRVAVSNLMRLLDLPDDVLDLLAAGELTEGHGRALLLAAATTTAGASPAPRRRPAGRCARPRRAPARPVAGGTPGAAAPPRGSPPRPARGRRAARRGPAGPSAPTSACPPAAAATASRSSSPRSTTRWRSRRASGAGTA